MENEGAKGRECGQTRASTLKNHVKMLPIEMNIFLEREGKGGEKKYHQHRSRHKSITFH